MTGLARDGGLYLPETIPTLSGLNDLDGLPLDLANYLDFYEQRKVRVRERLVKALGASPAAAEIDE